MPEALCFPHVTHSPDIVHVPRLPLQPRILGKPAARRIAAQGLDSLPRATDLCFAVPAVDLFPGSLPGFIEKPVRCVELLPGPVRMLASVLTCAWLSLAAKRMKQCTVTSSDRANK